MKTLQSFLASTALLVSLGLAPALMPAPALAVDNMESVRCAGSDFRARQDQGSGLRSRSR